MPGNEHDVNLYRLSNPCTNSRCSFNWFKTANQSIQKFAIHCTGFIFSESIGFIANSEIIIAKLIVTSDSIVVRCVHKPIRFYDNNNYCGTKMAQTDRQCPIALKIKFAISENNILFPGTFGLWFFSEIRIEVESILLSELWRFWSIVVDPYENRRNNGWKW